MNTTSIFVELVVIGFHTLLWIVMLILTILGFQDIDFDKIVSIDLAIPAFLIAYIFGIVMDKFADTLFIPRDMKLRSETREKYKQIEQADLLVMRFYILAHSTEIYKQLEYIRSRMRIARASVLNFTVTVLVALLLIWLRTADLLLPVTRLWLAIGVLVLGVLFTAACYQAWEGLTKSYTASTIFAYRVLKGKEQAKLADKDK